MKTRRPKGLGTVERVAKGFRARKTVNGQRVSGSIRKTRLEAERDLRELGKRATRSQDVPTLRDYAKTLLDGRFKKRLRQSTWETHETVWRTHLYDSRLGRTRLDRISRRDVQGFIDGLEGSAPYARRIGAFVSVVLSTAVEDEYIVVNPAAKVTYPPLQERENRTLTPSEAIKLLNPSTRLEAMILVAAHTGLRRGEICGLRWEDVKDGYIRVRRAIAAIRGGNIETEVKTKKSMANVPLTPEAQQAISEQPKRGKYVFSTEDGKPVDPSNLSRDWRNWADKNGLHGMRFHDLRGSYVSLLIETGNDIRTVQELARHADARTTLAMYARTRQPVKDQAIERLRGAIVPKIEPTPVDTLQNKTQVA